MGYAGGEIVLFHSKTGEVILSRVTPDKDPLPVMARLSDVASLPVRAHVLCPTTSLPFSSSILRRRGASL
jgi:hypothetical protein